ncbi:beta-ketoacyl synthase N-terminal-like domain-containing protein [Spirillospora sp. CA-294931]|uniref:beta-ketoacyl synthase N-terminal-like domain-containing protein n=1 Tax=Spirillospora sp. CA-294931 TaxID=3240042 RepID=UPI003D8BBBA8
MSRRTVITGLGVVAPTGIGAVEHWETTLAGTARIAPLDGEDAARLPIRVAGRVEGFDKSEFVESRLAVQTDHWTWMALAATELALVDAALDPSREDPFALSVVTASASGGNAFGQKEIQALWRDGPRNVSAYQSIGWFYAASSGQISIKHQLKGACGVLVADAAGAVDALASAARQIRRGLSAVVTGGTEAPLSPYALACQSRLDTLNAEADPALAYRPFAAGAAGFVPGEGGAVIIAEELEHARERGAPQIYAEVAGCASTHDAYHVMDAAPGHTQLAAAMRQALDRAGLAPADVSVVFADGAGDAERDRLEIAALHEVFGDRRVPVTVPKTMTGRLCSGGAALDVASAALALSGGVIPPTVNVGPIEELDLVTSARRVPDLSAALVVARGTGGFNAAAVLTLPPDQPS